MISVGPLTKFLTVYFLFSTNDLGGALRELSKFEKNVLSFGVTKHHDGGRPGEAELREEKSSRVGSEPSPATFSGWQALACGSAGTLARPPRGGSHCRGACLLLWVLFLTGVMALSIRPGDGAGGRWGTRVQPAGALRC